MTLTITANTISGNVAAGIGGGIATFGTTTIGGTILANNFEVNRNSPGTVKETLSPTWATT